MAIDEGVKPYWDIVAGQWVYPKPTATSTHTVSQEDIDSIPWPVETRHKDCASYGCPVATCPGYDTRTTITFPELKNPPFLLTCESDSAEETPPRKEILLEAAELITGDRNNSYGPPMQDFQRSAGAANAMGYGKINPSTGEFEGLAAHDVAILVSIIKISRLQTSPGKRDNWTDLAGYAGCGYECSLEEQEDQ